MMKSIRLCFMLLFIVLPAACIPIQAPSAAPATAPPAATAGSAAELGGEFSNFAPGVWTPAHTHSGMSVVMVR